MEEEYILSPYPEVDEIIDNACEQFRAFAQNKWKEFEKEKQDFALKKEKLNECDEKLRQKEAELNRREEILKTQEDEQYQRFKREWFDTLGIWWKPGDTVYRYRFFRHQSTCPACEGKKTMDVTFSGKVHKIPCPICNGTGFGGGDYDTIVSKIRIETVNYSVSKLIENNKGVPETKVCADIDDYNSERSSTNLYVYDFDEHKYMYVLPKTVYRTEEECKQQAEKELRLQFGKKKS